MIGQIEYVEYIWTSRRWTEQICGGYMSGFIHARYPQNSDIFQLLSVNLWAV